MQKNYVGIDVSKLTLDAAIIIEKEGVKQAAISHQFSNDLEGMKTFEKWLTDLKVSFDKNSIVVIENTGIYHRVLWQFCSTKLLPIYIGNAAHLKWSFGIARGKNDKVDALRLCDYSYRYSDTFKPTQALNKTLITLKDLHSNRVKLVQQKNAIIQTLNELKQSNDKALQKTFETLNKNAIDGLKKSIDLIEKQMMIIVKNDAAILKNYNRILTVPGIGKITAMYLIACTQNFSNNVNGKQLASYAGVVPFEHSSGTSVKGRNKVHHMANKELKSLLTMGALSLIKSNQEFKDYYNRKIAEGKKHLQVINAIKNKILLRVASVIKQDKDYEKREPIAAIAC